MIKIVEIENALERINGDIFQEFCNHFLYLKLNPNSITPIGSVIGKEKSRKGIPDSYFTSADNELIFAEYTTRERLKSGESFYNKLKSDLENCFDTSKTGLKNEEINKVILCFTERIKPEERKNLEELCKKYNANCILDLKGIRDLSFAVLDYPILGSFVGIKIGTGQIQEPSEFIANYEKNRISTPLSNSFKGRETEIKDGLNYLETNDVLLVYGAAGTGKSKYAIELAKQFSDKNDYTFLCIGNKGISIWEDLKSFINKDKKYVLLVDDANRLTQNFQLILSLLGERISNSLKIIVTVRDYAYPQIKTIANNCDYSSIEIKIFSNDEIKSIIQSEDFKIKEPSYVDRILKVAQGNARLAIMSAKVALKSNNITQLNDASQIYDEYFEPLFTEVPLLKKPITLKALALIAFFSRIDKSNREFCDYIFSSLEIDEEQFWEICYSLHESELVDLFEQQIVKVSDQIFATYIFYKAVIENETLSFNFFLDNYLDYENKIQDTIVPILNTFDYKKIEVKLKPIIINKWIEIEKQNEYKNSLMFLDLFWYYLGSQVFIFLKKQIDIQVKEITKEYRYTYEMNEFSSGTGKDIELLSKYRNHNDELFKDALELLFYYALNAPSKMPALVYTLKEKFSFSRFGYMYGDHVQHLLFEFLFQNAKAGENKEIYQNIICEILPHYLKIEYRENEGNGRSITLYTFHLWLSKSIESFRGKCFEYLLSVANKTDILEILYRLNFYEYKDSNEILNHDKKYIFQIINNHFHPSVFEDCFVLQHILEGFDYLKVDYTKEISDVSESQLYRLAEVLKKDKQRKKEIGWKEEEKLHEKELLEYCSDFDVTQYDALFENVSSILGKIKNISRDNLEWQYENSLNIILGNIAKSDPKLFLEVITINFDKYQFNLHFVFIFNQFFQNNPKYYFELFKLIKGLKENIKFSFYQTLNIDFANDEHLPLLYAALLDSIKSLSTQYVFWDLTFVSKFDTLKSEQDIYSEILLIVLAKVKTEEAKISVGQQFIEKCASFDSLPYELLVEAYFYSNKIENHFDHDKKLFRILLQRDFNFIIRFLKYNSPNRISYHDLEHERFDFIWELGNSTKIIDSVFEFFITNEPFYFSERAVAAFFPQINSKYGNKPIDYLRGILEDKYLNDKYVDVVFSIICYKYPSLKMEILEMFLTLNNDFEVFRKLEIIQRSKSWSGSYIPVVEGEKKIWENVLSVLESLPNRMDFYEHKEYTTRQIGYCDLRIKDEMKREFHEDF